MLEVCVWGGCLKPSHATVVALRLHVERYAGPEASGAGAARQLAAEAMTEANTLREQNKALKQRMLDEASWAKKPLAEATGAVVRAVLSSPRIQGQMFYFGLRPWAACAILSFTVRSVEGRPVPATESEAPAWC